MRDGGFRYPAAAGPTQNNGLFRPDASATLIHSSMKAVAVVQERDPPRLRLRIMGIGRYDCGSSAARFSSSGCACGAGEPWVGMKR